MEIHFVIHDEMKKKTKTYIRDRKGTPKNLCDKDFAELSGELSGTICLKTLVLLGSALELFRNLFGAVRAIFWLWGSFFWPLIIVHSQSYGEKEVTLVVSQRNRSQTLSFAGEMLLHYKFNC